MTTFIRKAMIASVAGGVAPLALAIGPFASSVVAFDPGQQPDTYYGDPNAALGSPARDTGDGIYAGVVSMFNPPYNADQIVGISEGGFLTLRLGTPVTNDPGHLYGVDMNVFGNGGFVDGDYPNGRNLSPALSFGFDLMRISVSADGTNFVTLPQLFTEGLFPTQGYLDAGPFGVSGSVPTDFTRPMNPALSLNSFSGLSFAQSMALYDGSGGGTPVDISASGLSSVSYVRIEVPDDGDPFSVATVEIDAIAAVPEPNCLFLMAAGLLAQSRRGRG